LTSQQFQSHFHIPDICVSKFDHRFSTLILHKNQTDWTNSLIEEETVNRIGKSA
jgi:hypothetical protein